MYRRCSTGAASTVDLSMAQKFYIFHDKTWNSETMNFDRYPWLRNDLSLPEALEAIDTARESFIETGAAIFPEFITQDALKSSRDEAVAKAETAFL